MELVSVLLAILGTPFKAVGRPARAVWTKAIAGSVFGPATAVHAWDGHQSPADALAFGIALLPKNWNNNTSYGAVDKFFDMTDYEGILFLIAVGAVDVAIDAKAQESVNADGSSPSDITSAAITQIGSTQDNRLVMIDIKKTTLTKRYAGVAVNVPSGTTNNIAVIAVRYGKVGTIPVTQQAAGSNAYLTGEIIRV
jgi:hypothetical protein